jgi:hypothetical protein
MEVKLKKNGWYNRLQKFTFGNSKPELYSLCPFFWLTIFCIVSIPITLIIKSIKFCLNEIDKSIEKNIDKWLNSLTLEDAGQLYVDETFAQKPFIFKNISAYSMWQKWLDKQKGKGLGYHEFNELREKAIDAYYAKRAALNNLNEAEELKNEALKIKNRILLEAKEEKQRIRAQRIKMIWVPIVLWTQRIFNLTFTLTLMAISALLINLIIMSYNPSVTLEFLKYFGIFILISVCLILISYLTWLYIKWNRDNNRTPIILRPLVYIGPPLVNFFVAIGKGFRWLGLGFINIFGLFWEYFKANKNDYCPAINWDDEDNK